MPSEYMERFRQFLADRGHELTPRREAIVNVVLAMRCDFTAEKLNERLRLLNAGQVSRSTLIRTLERLIEAKLLERIVVVDESYYRAVF